VGDLPAQAKAYFLNNLMRITRDTLLKLAQDAVSQRTRSNRGIIAVFAAGSLLDAEPLLGGTTDIDLFVIHDSEPALPREIVQMSPEIHLDIAHHAQALYRQPRHLRCDPWLGSTVYNNPILLHDTQHWFEFTQASARSQFWLAANVIARARPLAENARQIWLSQQTSTAEMVERVDLFLQALESAANAIACLSGSPLTERRFLLGFPDRARAANNPGLSHGLLGLLGGNQVDAEEIKTWLPGWRLAFQSAGGNPDAPLRLHPHRQVYYERSIDFYLASDAVAALPLASSTNLDAGSRPPAIPF
jgi:hypothetical protein